MQSLSSFTLWRLVFQSGPNIQVLLGTGVFAVWVVLVMTAAWNAPGDDLSPIYLSGRLMTMGESHRIYNRNSKDFSEARDPVWLKTARQCEIQNFPHPYVQIPIWAKVISPLAGSVSFPVFMRWAIFGSLCCMGGMILLTQKLWRLQPANVAVFGIAVLALSLSEPFKYSIGLVQTHPLFLFSMLLATYCSHRDRPWLAGFILACATIVKITPLALGVYWLCTGRWREAIGFAASLVGLAALSVGWLGGELHLEYLDVLRRASGESIVAFNNQCVRVWLMDMISPPNYYFDWTLVETPKWIGPVNLLLAGICFSAILAVRWKTQRTPREYDRWGVPAIILMSILFAPIAWSHYYVFIVTPVLLFIDAAYQRRQYAWAGLAVLIIALNIYPIAVGPLANTDANKILWMTIVRSHLLSGVLSIVGLLALAWSERKPTPPKKLD